MVENIEAFSKELDQSGEQTLFLLEEIRACIHYTDWEGAGIDENTTDDFLKLFKAEIVYRKNRLHTDISTKPEVKNLRQELKTILQNELQRLPEYLEGLEPREKLNFICKLMPFVMPKVMTVHSEKGEPEFEKRNF